MTVFVTVALLCIIERSIVNLITRVLYVWNLLHGIGLKILYNIDNSYCNNV